MKQAGDKKECAIGGDVDHDLIAQADPSRDRFTDADLYGQIDKSQHSIPWWLVVMLVVVMALAVALNAPFLGLEGGHPLANLSARQGGSFLDGGMIAALLYVGGGFLVIFWYTCMRKGS